MMVSRRYLDFRGRPAAALFNAVTFYNSISSDNRFVYKLRLRLVSIRNRAIKLPRITVNAECLLQWIQFKRHVEFYRPSLDFAASVRPLQGGISSYA